MNNIVLVLGGYINGYSIIRELVANNVTNIALFDYRRSIASYSNKVKYYKTIGKDAESLKKGIEDLKKKCNYIVVFPTDDIQLKNLNIISKDIESYSYIPFNTHNLTDSLNKLVQYKFCEKYNIPYPKTKSIDAILDLELIKNFTYPLLIKPNNKNDSIKIFRSILIDNLEELNALTSNLENFLKKGFTFLASEYIPGDDTNIYTYVGYRSKKGQILNEWIGKKLNQFPDNYGIFSSGSNCAPEIVREQGRTLISKMNLYGVCQPEFKYDRRDKRYKLTEINLRSMMWHRVGFLSGINLHYTQYLDALNLDVKVEKQNLKNVIHFVYMKHEILNLLSRKGYWKFFKYNVFKNKRYFAVFNFSDLKPFLIDLLSSTKGIIQLCQKQLKQE